MNPFSAIKKYVHLFIPPIIISAVLLCVFRQYGLYPFGNGSIAWCDMNQQTVPLLMQFQDILSGKESIFFNMQNAGGMNFFGVFFFFLSSPFSLLTAFVEKSDIIFFVNILVILKLAVCGLTSAVYFTLCKPHLGKGTVVSFSVMYSLCGYGMLFYQNMMWLDVMYLFPLLMIGLERLVKQQKNILYLISLTAIFIMNYYIGYMIAVFIVIYIGLSVFGKPKNFSEICVKFISGTVLSALITAVVWLTSCLQISSSGRLSSVYDTIANSKFLTSYQTVLPLLFCTAFLFPVTALSLFSTRKRTPEQSKNLLLFLFTLVPLFIEPINLMWHTGNYMAFPARYGFIPVFIGLVCCADFLQDTDKTVPKTSKFKIILSLTALCLIVYWYCSYSKNYIEKNFSSLTKYTDSLWGNQSSFDGLAKLFVITAVVYTLIYIFYRKKRIAKQVFSFFLITVCVLESLGNATIYMASPYVNYPSRTETFCDIAGLSDKIQDDSFYRVTTDCKTADYNTIGALGYHSVSHYTSLTDKNFMFTQRRLGYSTVWLKTGSCGGTELTNGLYSVKYRISESGADENSVYSTDKFTIQKQPYSIGLGIICDNDFSQSDIPDNLTRAEIQQYLFSEIFGDKRIITNYNYDRENSHGIDDSGGKYSISKNALIEYHIYVSGKQSLYADCFDKVSNSLSEDYFNSMKIKVNGKTVSSQYPESDKNGLLSLGEFQNETVTVKIEVSKSLSCYSFGVFGLDLNKLSDAFDNAECANLSCTNGRITGTFRSDKNKTCLIAVPYNEGLKVRVNGKNAVFRKALSNFIAVDLESGENSIEICLIPKGFIAGVILTVIGLALFVLYLIFGKKVKSQNHFVKAFECITYFISLFGILTVYVLPIIITVL